MRILALSDTHDKIAVAIDAIHKHLDNIDLVVHLGDYIKDAKVISREFNIPFLKVGGNGDRTNSCDNNAYVMTDSPYGKILLTHGHLDNVNLGLANIYYKTKEMDCKVVIFGHTHSPVFEQKDDIYLINPGSISFPRSTEQGTYFILNIDKDKITKEQFFCETKKSLTTYAPGTLKNLFNNSDRF